MLKSYYSKDLCKGQNEINFEAADDESSYIVEKQLNR